MKELRIVIVISALLLSCGIATAQDPAKVGPGIYKCPFENERMRLCEVTFKPGASIPVHSHPDHLMYLMKGGRLRVTSGGKSSDLDFTAGQTVWMPAQTHSAENIGSRELRALVIELREPAPQRPASASASSSADGPPATDVQLMAGVLAASKLVEAEALMRFVHDPSQNTFDEITKALRGATVTMQQRLIYPSARGPIICPSGNPHMNSMCFPWSFKDWPRPWVQDAPNNQVSPK